MMMELGRKLIQKELEQKDEEIQKNRDKEKYRSKGKRKTAVKTKLGTIEYSRRMYLDTEANKYVYLE